MADDYAVVKVARAWDEGPRLRALALDVGATGFAAKHATPGQYVKARPAAGTEPGNASSGAFLAIASAPGAEQLELLLHKSEGRAGAGTGDRGAGGPPKGARSEPDGRASADKTVDVLARLGAGDSLEITAPGGKGYPIASETGRDILLFAGGSGISAIRSLLEFIAAHRADYGRTVLLYGARTIEDLGYRSLFRKWGDCKVEVIPVLSRAAAGWPGRAGYVTAALPELAIDPAKASAFVTGGKAFDASVTESLGSLGITRIFRNF